ncbi:MAG: hypothetical protein J5680_00460, partial [Neisseriaceae bacterium]|nr:hypothetical protein [Neisseriaceae bacterium]
AIVVIAYLSLWAWAVHWIDSQNNPFDFMGDEKNNTLEIAKTVWKIIPAIDRNKDAERALKISSFSVYVNMQDIQHLKNNLKINYDFISEYYEKYGNKLNNKLKGKFLLQKLIFMNRSLKEITRDIEVEKEIDGIFKHQQTIDLSNIENRLDWFPELIWFLYFHNAKDTMIYNDYIAYLGKDLKTMNKKNNTEAFFSILAYHQASLLCYAQNEEKNQQKREELNKESSDTFRLLQKYITPESKEFKILDNLTMENHIGLIIFPIGFFHSDSECKKEAQNFVSKMSEVSNILGKN